VTHASLSIEALHREIAAGRLCAAAVCADLLALVAEREPALGAMSDVVATSALREAQAVDRAVARGEPAGALAGIPVAVKSNIDTVPAACGAGLPHLDRHRPLTDAPVVARLRAAGAVIVGTTVTDSGGFGVTSPGVSNPRWPHLIAGGSSGGSAAAVAAGLCKAAIGTDTGGSVRIPAACCGVVGFKPTYGRVSTAGVRPLARSVDHVGVLGLSVADVRAVSGVIDPGFASLPGAHAGVPVIGVPASYLADASPSVVGPFRRWMDQCVALGFTVCAVDLPLPETALGSHLVLSLTEAALHHLDHAAEPIDVLPAVARDSIVLGLGYKSTEHLRALQQRRAFVDAMQRVFATVDVLALPTLPVPAPGRGVPTVRLGGAETGLLQALIRYTAPFDQSGHPALAVPWEADERAGAASIQLVAPHDADRRLLGFAEQLEGRLDGFGKARVA
jgi:aspartyl-tRNA(Asn)/glutamyl-tRNA(Gln) amidotransferase subunit A